MRWVALFSRTGSEITNLSKILGKEPDLILTNKKDFENSTIPKDKCIIIDGSDESIRQYIMHDDIITLHGYLKIIPESLCNDFNIYNGHPGLITKYPELKGINPQIRCLNNSTVGSVIHKVTAIVDDGPIISSKEIDNYDNYDNHYNYDSNTIFTALAEISLDLWVEFFNKELYANRY